MYINMLIEDYTQRLLCEDISPSIAWAIIKAQYEERTEEDEELWVYIGSADRSAKVSYLKEENNNFEVKAIDTLTEIKNQFDYHISKVKEG